MALTPMGEALKEANSLVESADSNSSKYVLFMTDGLPGGYTTFLGNEDVNRNSAVANEAVGKPLV